MGPKNIKPLNVRAFKTVEALRRPALPTDVRVLPLSAYSLSLPNIVGPAISMGVVDKIADNAGSDDITQTVADQYASMVGAVSQIPQGDHNPSSPFRIFQNVAAVLDRNQNPADWAASIAQGMKNFMPPSVRVAFDIVNGVMIAVSSISDGGVAGAGSGGKPKALMDGDNEKPSDNLRQLQTFESILPSELAESGDESDAGPRIDPRPTREFSIRGRQAEARVNVDIESIHPLLHISNPARPWEEDSAPLFLHRNKPILIGRHPEHKKGSGHRESGAKMLGKERGKVFIRDGGVSEKHALIGYDSRAKSYYIEDLGSEQGTLVNGEKISAGKRVFLVGKSVTIRFGNNVEINFYPPMGFEDRIQLRYPVLTPDQRNEFFKGTLLEESAAQDGFDPVSILAKMLEESHHITGLLVDTIVRIDAYVSYENHGERFKAGDFQRFVDIIKEHFGGYAALYLMGGDVRRFKEKLLKLKGSGKPASARTLSIADYMADRVPAALSRHLQPYLRLKNLGHILERLQLVADDMKAGDSSDVIPVLGDTAKRAYSAYHQKGLAGREQDLSGVEKTFQNFLKYMEGEYRSIEGWFRDSNLWAKVTEGSRKGRFIPVVKIKHALDLWKALERVRDLCRKEGVPFAFKMADSAKGLERTDGVMVYFTADHQEFAYHAVTNEVSAHPEWFRNSLPLFAAQVLDGQGKPIKGLGFGEDPNLEHASFGSIRSISFENALRLIRKLITAGQAPTKEEALRIMARFLDTFGVDIENPAFENGKRGGRPGREVFDFIFRRTDQGRGILDPQAGPTVFSGLESPAAKKAEVGRKDVEPIPPHENVIMVGDALGEVHFRDGKQANTGSDIPGMTPLMESAFQMGGGVMLSSRSGDGYDLMIPVGDEFGMKKVTGAAIKVYNIWMNRVGFGLLSLKDAVRHFKEFSDFLESYGVKYIPCVVNYNVSGIDSPKEIINDYQDDKRLTEFGMKKTDAGIWYHPALGRQYKTMVDLMRLCPEKLMGSGVIKEMVVGSERMGSGLGSSYNDGTIYIYALLLGSSRAVFSHLFLHEIGHGIYDMLESDPATKERLETLMEKINETKTHIILDIPHISGTGYGFLNEFLAEMNSTYILAGEFLRKEINRIEDPEAREAYKGFYQFFLDLHDGKEFSETGEYTPIK